MIEQEQGHAKSHENCIKEVKEDLMPQKVSSVALYVFDNSKYASDEYENTERVQHVQQSLPWEIVLGSSARGSPSQTPVEDYRCDHEHSCRYALVD